jgi:hypothetical protein
MKPPEDLDERLDAEFAPAWRPEAGEKLVGQIVVISERTGGFGRYPIVTLRQDDGSDLAIHAFHSVLSSRLAEVQPKPGERLGVKYEGKVEGAKQPYHSYKVAIDRPEHPVDWSAYSGDDLPEETTATPVSELHKPLEPEGEDIPF